MNNIKNHNVVIVGGGPAGLSAGLYLARASITPLIIEGSPAGGQLTLTSEVENYPGVDSLIGPRLIQVMKEQAQKFGCQFKTENVTNIKLIKKNSYAINTDQNNLYTSSTILIASGASSQWLGLNSEEKFRGRGVSACATCDGFFFKNKTVAVVGGGDAAMEEALTLTKLAHKVYILHRRNEFRASKIMQKRVINNPKITILWESQVKDILGEEKVTGIKIITSNKKSLAQLNNKSILKLDGVFVAIGHKPNTKFLKDSGILLDEKGYIITSLRFANKYAKFKIQSRRFSRDRLTIQNKKLEKNINKFNLDYQSATSVTGIFAAGDCVDSIYRQASTASGMGVVSALEIERYLEDKK